MRVLRDPRWPWGLLRHVGVGSLLWRVDLAIIDAVLISGGRLGRIEACLWRRDMLVSRTDTW